MKVIPIEISVASSVANENAAIVKGRDAIEKAVGIKNCLIAMWPQVAGLPVSVLKTRIFKICLAGV